MTDKEENAELRAEVTCQQTAITRYRAALEHYATHKNWTNLDGRFTQSHCRIWDKLPISHGWEIAEEALKESNS